MLLLWWSTGKAGSEPHAPGLVCEAEVGRRGMSQDIGMFVRWELVKETRRYFKLN